MKNDTSKENASVSLETGLTTTFMVLVSLVGTVGNALVILAILHKRSLRTIPNYFLFNLAVCDFLNASVAVPLRLAEGFMPQSIPCHIVIAVTILFDGLSRINVVFVSLDRFAAVRFPFTYDAYVTPKTASVLIVCGWIVMAVFAILPVVGIGAAAPIKSQLPKEGICFFSTSLSKEYLLSYLVAFCLIPLVLVTPINCYLLKSSHRQLRQIHNLQISMESSIANGVESLTNVTGTTEQNDPRRNRRFVAKQRRVLRMVLALVGLFVILVTPITIIDLISSFGFTSVPPMVAKIAVCMIYTNATINVFVYAGFNTEFRLTFLQLFRAGKSWLTRLLTLCTRLCRSSDSISS